MKNSKLYAAIIIVMLIVGAAVLVVLSTNTSPKPLPDLTEQIPDVISSGLSEFNYSLAYSNIELTDYRYIDENWVVARAIFTDVPVDSEGRVMIYILKRDNEKLKLVGFSAVGLTSNDVPDGTPDYVLEEANKPW